MYGRPYQRPNSGSNPLRSVQALGIPVTVTLVAANVLTFLVGFFAMGSRIDAGGGPFWWLAFSERTFPAFFWTLITWPLVAPIDLLSLLFGGLWAWWVGGSLERSWGSRDYGVFIVATAALTALTLWLGGRILGAPVFAQGLWLAIAAPTVAWCVLNAREVIRFYAIIPVPAPVLMWLTIAFTWFTVSASARSPLLGAFALSGCVAAYWYAKNGRYLYRGYASSGSSSRSSGSQPNLRFQNFERESAGPRKPGFNLLRWWKVRQESKRLEQLMRRSGFTDDPDERDRRR